LLFRQTPVSWYTKQSPIIIRAQRKSKLWKFMIYYIPIK
jgi:hypothetical protein